MESKKSDLGGQEIVEISGKHYRLPDFEEVVYRNT
jgi:hypothetical protein